MTYNKFMVVPQRKKHPPSYQGKSKQNALYIEHAQRSSNHRISSKIQILLNRADESHQAAKLLLDKVFSNFAAAQSYYTMFYLAEALLHSKGLEFSSHSAVMAAYGKEFAKTEY